MSSDPVCRNMNEDVQILEYLQNSKLRGVRLLIDRYGKGMVMIAFRMLDDLDKAEKVVYGTFWRLWREKSFAGASPPLRPFLYEEIKKACIDAVTD